MLWRPATYGERAFLHIYEALGRHVSVDACFGGTLDFLVNQQSFQEFAKLHGTIETFIPSGTRLVCKARSVSRAKKRST
ncbi:hypothetical protein ACVWWG_009256 [Bradyrhizobium sp. LB7.2]